MTKTALYRHYDTDGQLLYVGVSKNPTRRMYEHKCRTDWAADVKRTEIIWFDQKSEAIEAEREAIRDERPARNHLGTGPRVTAVSTDTIAGQIIMQCGGVEAVASMTDRTESVVYRWTYPKDKGGTNGRIPQEAQLKLLEAAQRGECDVVADDFFPKMSATQ